jgi:hypothetical protein
MMMAAVIFIAATGVLLIGKMIKLQLNDGGKTLEFNSMSEVTKAGYEIQLSLFNNTGLLYREAKLVGKACFVNVNPEHKGYERDN